MTIKEITESTEDVLMAADVAKILKSDPNSIRYQAKENPALLGFPVCCFGNSVRIPRLSFLKFMGVNTEDERRKNE